MRQFESTLRRNDSGGCAIELPFDAKAAFGHARAPVRATLEGHEFRTTLMRYGGADFLGVNRSVREAAAIEPGQTVAVTLELDDEPRSADPPPELAAVLEADAKARAAYEALSYTHQREYAGWVGEAKRAETRLRRAARATAMLTEGVLRP